MHPIRSIYPNVNGEKDGARIYLNKIFYPSNPLESASPLTILWYSIGKMPEPNVYYNVNHFVAVTDITERGLNTNRQQSTKRKIASSGSSACESDCFHEDDVADDDTNYDDRATQSRKHLPLKVRQLSFNGSEDGNITYCYDADRDDGVGDDDGKEYADKYIDTIDSDISSHNVPIENVNATDHQKKEVYNYEKNDGCINQLKQNGKFLSNEDILSIITNTNNCPTDIPPGPKNNVYVVIDITGKSHKGKLEFPDDCGVWDTHVGTTVNQTFLLESENRLRLQKRQEYLQFLQKQLNYNASKYIHSSNGKFKCIQTKIDAGRKPGQRKRAKSEQTSQKKWR
ncbi:hypothetical protein ACJMK2_002242 [Sinanodonta woodiana]|uniref:Uncharacterized protein n=1 Tax=Sinanodonta woodiana TaxID=1069815 RepID=A0ABD3XUS7_SINWO